MRLYKVLDTQSILKGAKLLQWYYWFGMAIFLQPLGQITWPKDQFVAKGLYFVCPHQSEVKFPRVFVVHFMHHIKVRYCNDFGGHCIMSRKSYWAWATSATTLHHGKGTCITLDIELWSEKPRRGSMSFLLPQVFLQPSWHAWAIWFSSSNSNSGSCLRVLAILPLADTLLMLLRVRIYQAQLNSSGPWWNSCQGIHTAHWKSLANSCGH